MTTNVQPGDELPFDGERFVPGAGVGIAYEHWIRYFLARELTSGKDVLDVACGEGYGSAYLAGSARSVVGFDASATAVSHAQHKYGGGTNVRFEQATVQGFFEQRSGAEFDAVIAFEVIEHLGIEEQELLLDGVARVLRPDGFAVISTPDKLHYTDKPLGANPFHVREYYRGEFEEELRRHFPHVVLLEQALLTGCAVFARGARTTRVAQMRWTDLVANRGDCRPELSTDGEYLVAVVSRTALPELPSVLLADFSRKLMSEALRFYRDELERVTGLVHAARKAQEDAEAAADKLRRERDELVERERAREQPVKRRLF